MGEEEKISRPFLASREDKPAVQAAGQTLPNATPQVGKIDPFSKIVVTFEPDAQN